MKLGLFELKKEKEKRSDWIFIIDTILEQGTKKCLLILGISYQKWFQKLQENRSNLQHHDLEILALEIVDSTRGEIVTAHRR